MPYTPQGLRELIQNQSARERAAPRTAFPDELSKLKDAIMRGGSKAAEVIGRPMEYYGKGVNSLANRLSRPINDDINDMPVNTEQSVIEALPPDLPEGYGLNTPRGGQVLFQSQLDADNGEEMNDIASPNTPAKKEAEYYSKDESAPTSGKEALANQYSDIEKLLGRYTDDKDDNKFTDFLKLTLARAAMSKDNNYLAALSHGAGEATIDQIGQQDKRERNRMEAIDKILQARRYGADEAMKREELDIRKPLYQAQADYYSGRAAGTRDGKPTKIPLGFDGAANKAIKDTLGDKFDDLDPKAKTQIKSAAADIWKEAGGTLSPSQAVDEAMSQLDVQEEGYGNPFVTNRVGIKPRGTPSLAEIDAAIARKEAARGSQ